MKLAIENVEKKFDEFIAVDNLSIEIDNGVYGLLGVNGAGKTTLMRMICTLLKPTNGHILCDGNDIFQMGAEYRKMLGYLPQDFGYYPDFSVKDYLLYVASIKGLQPIVAKKRMEDLLEQVGMTRYSRKKMKHLSGGMLRRVGIAQAMLNDPKILVLDEPTAGLDPNERVRFRNLISELSTERLVLLSTHIVSDIEYVANKILLMKDGSIRKNGTASELLSGMSEKVWICKTDKSNSVLLNKKYKVSNIKMEEDEAALRIISSNKPIENAVETKATLEDLFLDYFDEMGEENSEI